MVEKMNAASSLVEVVDRILDTRIIIDKFLAFLQSRILMNTLPRNGITGDWGI